MGREVAFDPRISFGDVCKVGSALVAGGAVSIHLAINWTEMQQRIGSIERMQAASMAQYEHDRREAREDRGRFEAMTQTALNTLADQLRRIGDKIPFRQGDATPQPKDDQRAGR